MGVAFPTPQGHLEGKESILQKRGKITTESIERLLSSVDLVELIGKRVDLKRSGTTHSGKCPFHADGSPSFHVYPDNYYCFGCNANGNAIKFEMESTGASFPETVESLAGSYGVELSYEDGPNKVDDEKYRKRKQLQELTLKVSEFYSRCLQHEKYGNSVRAYLKGRGITAETAEKFNLGFSLDQNSLPTLAKKNGFNLDHLKTLGLVKESQRFKDRPYDFFRGRLMVPITSERGESIAFGARELPKPEGDSNFNQRSGPKYLNSAESEIFSKSHVLFNLHKARLSMKKTREVIVVEGYMDAIALSQAGIENVVAVLGTALTESHVHLLNKHVDRVIICFDADKAGQEAMLRSFRVAWPLNLVQLHAFSVQGAKDPDELVQLHGKEAFLEQKSKAPPLVHAAASYVTKSAVYSEERVREVRKHIVPVVEQNPGRAEKQGALRDLAQWLGLPDASGLTSLSNTRGQKAQPQSKNQQVPHAPPSQQNSHQGSSPHESVKRAGASSQDQAAFKLASAREFRFLVSLRLCEQKDVPIRLQRIFFGTVFTRKEEEVRDTEENVARREVRLDDDAVCLQALSSQLSLAGMSVMQELLSRLFSKQARSLCSSPQESSSDFGKALLSALVAYEEKDVEMMDKFGIDSGILALTSPGGAKFSPDVSIFEVDNASFLRFLLKDALLAKDHRSISSQTQKRLLDLEITYLDNELARWTAVEQDPQRTNANVKNGGEQRTRIIINERARRLQCLQQENSGQDEPDSLLR